MDLVNKYSWIKEIDHKKYLNENESLIVEAFGIEGFVKLLSMFGKTRIYFGSGFFYAAKKDFIRNNSIKYSTRQFVRMLNVSDEFVRKCLRETLN